MKLGLLVFGSVRSDGVRCVDDSVVHLDTNHFRVEPNVPCVEVKALQNL